MWLILGMVNMTVWERILLPFFLNDMRVETQYHHFQLKCENKAAFPFTPHLAVSLAVSTVTGHSNPSIFFSYWKGAWLLEMKLLPSTTHTWAGLSEPWWNAKMNTLTNKRGRETVKLQLSIPIKCNSKKKKARSRLYTDFVCLLQEEKKKRRRTLKKLDHQNTEKMHSEFRWQQYEKILYMFWVCGPQKYPFLSQSCIANVLKISQ